MGLPTMVITGHRRGTGLKGTAPQVCEGPRTEDVRNGVTPGPQKVLLNSAQCTAWFVGHLFVQLVLTKAVGGYEVCAMLQGDAEEPTSLLESEIVRARPRIQRLRSASGHDDDRRSWPTAENVSYGLGRHGNDPHAEQDLPEEGHVEIERERGHTDLQTREERGEAGHRRSEVREATHRDDAVRVVTKQVHVLGRKLRVWVHESKLHREVVHKPLPDRVPFGPRLRIRPPLHRLVEEDVQRIDHKQGQTGCGWFP